MEEVVVFNGKMMLIPEEMKPIDSKLVTMSTGKGRFGLGLVISKGDFYGKHILYDRYGETSVDLFFPECVIVDDRNAICEITLKEGYKFEDVRELKSKLDVVNNKREEWVNG